MLLKVQRTAFGGEADLVRPQPTASQPASQDCRAGNGRWHPPLAPRNTCPSRPGAGDRDSPPACTPACRVHNTSNSERREERTDETRTPQPATHLL